MGGFCARCAIPTSDHVADFTSWCTFPYTFSHYFLGGFSMHKLMGVLVLGVLAGSASADIYELRVTGTAEAFGGFPAVAVQNKILFDSAAIPVTNVSQNVTSSVYQIVSQQITVGGQVFFSTNTPTINITDTVPGFFGNPDQFDVFTTFAESFSGLSVTSYSLYAFDYGLGAISDTNLPTHASYFSQFTGGQGGLISQISFTDGHSNFAIGLQNQRVTLRVIPAPGGTGLLAVAGLTSLRLRRR